MTSKLRLPSYGNGYPRILSIGVAFAAIVASTPAAAVVDTVVRDALAQHAAGKAAAAYAALLPLAATRAGDADFDYALGIAAADSGHFGEAIIALQRVIAVQPTNAPARAEIARVYALTGDVDTARAQFNTVLQDPSLPDPVRQRFTQLERSYSKQIAGGGSDVTGFADLSGGYDSNINTATNLTSVTIPLFAFFGPGALNGNARAAHDGFLEAQAGVSGVTAIGRQDRLFGSILGNYHDNLSSRTFDQAGLTATTGFAHSLANRDTLSLSGQVQQFWLGRASYRQAYGAIGQYTHLLSNGRALSASGQYFHFSYNNQPLLDANRIAIAVSYAARRFVISASGGHEATVRKAGDAQSNSFGEASIGAELPLSPRLSFVGGAGFDIRRYDAPDVLFLINRHDERVDVSAGLKLLVAKRLTIRPRFTYSRNFSNIAIYDYQRVTGSLGARYEF
jgi:tetratricopeptide (TPR) repeat protein